MTEPALNGRAGVGPFPVGSVHMRETVIRAVTMYCAANFMKLDLFARLIGS